MNAAKATPVKFAPVSYLIEFGLVIAFYTGAIVLRQWLFARTDGHLLRVVLVALPVLPIWLMFLAVLRHYRRIDELAKRKLLENVAISAGLMVSILTSYALLKHAGLPELAITWAWPTLATCWAVAGAISELRDR